MSGIPTTGTNLWSVLDPYPWSGDDQVTDSWIADLKYLTLTGSACGQVAQHKGTTGPLVQATAGNKPAFAATWNANNHGLLGYDGVDDWMSCDALAAKIAGNPPHDFTLVQCFRLRSVSVCSPWSFSASSNSATIFTIIPQTGGVIPDHAWQTNYYDDAAHANTETADIAADTNRVVLTTTFIASTKRTSIRVNGVLRSVAHGSLIDVGLCSYTKFTVGAFRGSSLLNAAAMDWRFTTFAPFVRPAANVLRDEIFGLTE